MDVKFKFEKFRDLDVIGVKIRPFPLTLHVGLTTVQRYRVACDMRNPETINF